MSSFVTVVFGARQYKIQCTPGKLLNDVLIEACDKAGLESDLYGLRHGKSALDLSLSCRLAHLPGGARLDLVRVMSNAESKVNVALNLPDHPRKVCQVSCSSTLRQILEIFQDQHDLLILNSSTSRQADGASYRRQAILQLNNKEYTTDEQLNATTLASLGIKSGSAVFRVSFRTTSEVAQISPQQASDESDASPALPTPMPVNSSIEAPEIDKSPKVMDDVMMEDSSLQQSPHASELPARNVEVLIPSSNPTPHFSSSSGLHETDDPEDMKPSIEQARAYQATLVDKYQTAGPLLTQKLRTQQALERKMKTKPEKCRIKFRFSEGTQLIGTFDPAETTSDVYRFIQSMTTDPAEPLILERLGDRQKIDNDTKLQLWRDLGFGAAVAVQVIGQATLKEAIKRQGRDVGKVIASSLTDSAETTFTDGQAHKDNSATGQEKLGRNKDSQEKKIPKWLQKTLGKK